MQIKVIANDGIVRTNSTQRFRVLIDEIIREMPSAVRICRRDKLHLLSPSTTKPTALEEFIMAQSRAIGDGVSLEYAPPEGGQSCSESIFTLRENIRTKKFLLAIREAVLSLESDHPRINVVDVGCGAIPIMGLYAALCSEKVYCTCLEINPHSVKMAQRIVEAFRLQDRVQVVQADALRYSIPHDQQIDVLISETMQSGLTHEPMVKIMTRFVPYVSKSGIILPSRVTVFAALVGVFEYGLSPFYVRLRNDIYQVIEPSWEQVVDYKPGDSLKEITFDLVTVGLSRGEYFLSVTSKVYIGRQVLEFYDSLITNPQHIKGDDGNPWIYDAAIAQQRDRWPSIRVSYQTGGSLVGAAHVL